ncbi:MAG TPA: ribosome maturation factor RimM [Candidatus Acidoferrales bacterium]
MPSDPIDRLTLARLLRPHGIRGEIAAEILTDFPERLTKLREVWLWDASAETSIEAIVQKCWLSVARGGQAVFKFAGVDRIEDVEKFRGLEVQVPLSERMELPAGSYFISELVGCEVWEVISPGEAEELETMLGIVTGVQESGTPVLEVDTLAGEVLIPLATEICRKIDVSARRIEVVMPEGLRNLNRKDLGKKKR